MSQDLFSYQGEQQRQRLAPLADRMRPQSLEDFEGQSGILADGRLLRRAIKADRVGNLILHGPPGVGKTTLARIIAGHTRAHFSSLNAVLAGVKDLRVEVDAARKRLERHGLRSILFIDEVHRFNSAQQDALLPWVENGTVTLIGATTENPYFEVNKALVSRSRLFRLLPLEPEDLHRLLQRALSDAERGYGSRSVRIDPEAADHLVDVANGDARSLLNALELAVESSEADAGGTVQIDLATAEESIQQRAVLYDKHGDAHYDTISAFIKSLRGSDPDAALFWLARMVEAGENPRFIFRRMLIAATPRPARATMKRLLDQCRMALGGWLAGMTLSATTVFLLTWLGLALLKAPLALLSALVCGLLTFVPTIGPTAATLLPLSMALLVSPTLMVQVLVLRLGLQNLEAFLLTPILLRRTVNLLPTVALMAQLSLGALLGLPGVLLALPLVVVLQVAMEQVVVRQIMDRWT